MVQNFEVDIQLPENKVITEFEELYQNIQSQIFKQERSILMTEAQEDLHVLLVQSKPLEASLVR